MGSSTTTVQSNEPWPEAAPYILQGLEGAGQLYNEGGFYQQPWTGGYVAPMSDWEFGGLYQTVEQGVPQQQFVAANQQAQQNLVNQAGINYLDPRFNTAINQGTQFSTSPYLTQGVQGVMGASVSPYLTSGVQSAMSGVNDATFNQTTQAPQTVNQQAQNYIQQSTAPSTTSAFNQAVQTGLSAAPSSLLSSTAHNAPGMDSGFNQATMNALGYGTDALMREAVQRGMQGGNYSGFDQTLSNMTSQGYTPELQEALRRNTMESVMPGLNQTFAGSGMTGSSLHQAELAKALASGMSQTEADFINRTQDRQIQAAQLGQAAHESGLDRALQAGQISQEAYNAAQQRGLEAGGMRQGALESTYGLSLDAAKALDASQAAARDQAMQAGAMSQAQREGDLGRVLSAGSTLGQLGESAAQRQLDAAGMQQQALQDTRAQQLAAGTTMEQAAAALRGQTLDAGNLANQAALAQMDTRLGAGTAAQNAYTQNQNALLSALGLTPSLTEAAYIPPSMTVEAGNRLSDYAQAILEGNIFQHGQTQAAPLDALNNYLSLVAGLGSGFGTSSQQASYSPGLTDILTSTAAVIGSLPPIPPPSDVRLKEDIRRVGQTDSGLPIYTFRYRGSPVTTMGVMAQDVIKVQPEAVAEIGGGYLGVHYDMLEG